MSLLESLLKALNNCLKHWKLSCGIVFLPVAVMFVLVMWVLDPVYSAEAIVTPPSSKSSIGGGLSKLLDGASGLSSMTSILGGDQSTDIVWTFFNSWELHDKVIEKFDLAEHYEFDGKFHADLLKKFRKNLKFEMNDENMYHVTFEDKDWKVAVQVVQYILAQADSMYKSYKTSQARQSRMYMDARLSEIVAQMDSLQDAFVKFQKERNVYDPEVQLESTMKYLSTLQADRDAVVIELSYEKMNRGENTKRYEELQNRLKSIDASLSRAVNGNQKKIGVMALNDSPELAATYLRMQNELRMLQTLYKFLRQESEQLYLEEHNLMSNLIILQPPWENDKKVWPLRGMMLMFTMLVSFVLALFISNAIEFFKTIDKNSALAIEINRAKLFFKLKK